MRLGGYECDVIGPIPGPPTRAIVPAVQDPRRDRPTDEEVNAPDARLWHPWLRINRVLRVMLHTRWSAEAWPQVKAEFTKALALRSQIRRAGWFN